MSDATEFVERSVAAGRQANVKSRRTSTAARLRQQSGPRALIMAWYHPERYHALLTWNLHQPGGRTIRSLLHGGVHEHLIPQSPASRFESDGSWRPRLFNPNDATTSIGPGQRAHGWLRNITTSLSARNAGHVVRRQRKQTPSAEHIWQGRPSVDH